MGRMILVEGLDLAGKSTLVEGLREHLGPDVRVANGQFCPDNPGAQVARELVRWDEDFGGLEAGALFLSSMLWDGRHFVPPQAGQVHLQDSCWLRTLAFEQLYGSPYLAQQMEEQGRSFPRFDKALFLTASLPERERRLRSRDKNDLHDLMAFRKPEKFLAIERRLAELVRSWEGGLVLDTDGLTAAEVVSQALQRVRSGDREGCAELTG
jgi:thymidylate kinase